MSLLKHALGVAGAALLAIAALDVSMRAALAGVLLLASSFAVHRRLVLVWWAGIALLAASFGHALWECLRGPTPLAVMSSLLTVFTALLVASWWGKQRQYFSAGAQQRPKLLARHGGAT